MCDIDCCCDIDCTDQMLQAFTCNHEIYTIHNYNHLSALPSCQLENSLFCIIRDNVKSRDHKIFDLNLRQTIKYKWPTVFADTADDDDRHHYQFGDPIYVYDELAEDVKTFEVAYSLTGDGYCQHDLPIEYLKNSVYDCVRHPDEMPEFHQRLQEKYQNTKILTSRKGVRNAALMSEHCSDANGDCVAIQMYDCTDTISNETCRHTNTSGTDTHMGGSPTIFIGFWHNFTTLLNCSVFFVHSNDINLDPMSMSVHRTEIRFLQPNESLHRRDSLSGNIGYNQGAPIIVGRLVSKSSNESDASDDRVISYFADDHFTEESLRLPKIRRNRRCTLTDSAHETIRFGENVIVKCDAGIGEEINKPATALPLMEKNFTDICQQFQNRIFYFLLHSVRPAENETNYGHIATMLSVYGNPRNMSSDWTRMQLTKQSMDAIGIRDQIVGIFDKDANENEFTCTNMILNVRYEFLYGQFKVDDVKNQKLLKKAFVELGNRVDLRFQLDEEIRVPVLVDVMFFDLTSNGMRVTFYWWIWFSLGVFELCMSTRCTIM